MKQRQDGSPVRLAEPETVAAPEPETEPIRIEVSLSSGDAEKKWSELTEGNEFTTQEYEIYAFLLDVQSELKNYRACNTDGSMPEDVMKRKEADVMAYKLLLELVQKKNEIEAKRLEESVNERMPEKAGSYLVCTAQSKAFVAHYYEIAGFSGRAARRITHWMPLPEPPKEADNAKSN